MKKKIVVFSEFFPPLLASDMRIFELTAAIKDKNFSFIVFPPFRFLSGKMPEKELDLFNEREMNDTVRAKGMTGHYLLLSKHLEKIWRFGISLGFLFSAPVLILKSMSIIKKEKPDLVLLNYPSVYTGLLGYVSARLKGVKCMLDLNDLIGDYTVEMMKIKPNSFKAKAIKSIQDFLIKHCDGVVCVSPYLKGYASELRKDEIEVISNGVEPGLFKPLKRKKNKIPLCVYCGRLDSWAGTEIIEKLAQKFYRHHKKINFLLVGEGPIERLILPDLTIRRSIPHTGVPKVLAKADIVLIPFPDSKIAHASSPIKLFEAMAMKKPIVASDVGGVNAVIKHNYNGVLCNPKNIDFWYKSIIKVLRNRKYSTRIAGQAYKDSKDYSWELLSQKLNKEIDRLI
jgi:glycosyltransferase involved in cell wall biosynthesis